MIPGTRERVDDPGVGWVSALFDSARKGTGWHTNHHRARSNITDYDGICTNNRPAPHGYRSENASATRNHYLVIENWKSVCAAHTERYSPLKLNFFADLCGGDDAAYGVGHVETGTDNHRRSHLKPMQGLIDFVKSCRNPGNPVRVGPVCQAVKGSGPITSEG